MIELWRAIGSVAPNELRDATLELHWAAQIVAAAGQTFAEKRSDDSHRAMRWDPARSAFVGADFAGSYPFRVALRPADLTVLLLDRDDGTLGSLALGGRTCEDARAWLLEGLAGYMGQVPELGRPEYGLPEHRVGRGEPFAAGREAERRALGALYGGAAALLSELAAAREDASPVTCWPHHFDIATLLTLERDEAGSATKTVGVGLAPMGGGYESWYWYVTPWPYPEPESLPELRGPGSWHTRGWTGAVLSGETIVLVEPAFREAVVRKFLDVSVVASAVALRG